MRKRRGLSEIVSAVLVIAVVISGMGIYSVASQQRILSDMTSVQESLQLAEDQVSELIEPLGMFRNGDTIGIFVHNYGLKNILVVDVFVNGTKNMRDNINPAIIEDLNDINSAGNGLTVDITTVSGKITDAVINTGGTKYSAGDRVTVNAGNSDAILEITTVNIGVPTGISIIDDGSGYSDINGVTTTLSIIGTIPSGQTVEIVLDFTGDVDIPASVENVIVRTNSGKIIEFQK